MASREYCSNISTELEEWSEKLHKLSSEIDRISTGDKYKLFPQIEELHIILTELDDRLCSLSQSCQAVDETFNREEFEKTAVAPEFNLKSKERFDYEFGG